MLFSYLPLESCAILQLCLEDYAIPEICYKNLCYSATLQQKALLFTNYSGTFMLFSNCSIENSLCRKFSTKNKASKYRKLTIPQTLLLFVKIMLFSYFSAKSMPFVNFLHKSMLFRKIPMKTLCYSTTFIQKAMLFHKFCVEDFAFQQIFKKLGYLASFLQKAMLFSNYLWKFMLFCMFSRKPTIQ